MRSVGLMTFHASYNFGSVMQAWATQRIVSEMGYDCEIINFRTAIQKDKYSIFPIRMGYQQLLRNIFQISHILEKNRSNKKYEDFIQNTLKISEEYNTIDELKNTKQYDIYLAGSDQIWGYHIPEFDHSETDVRGAYYFNFTKGYKISYASSFGTASTELLQPYGGYLKDFSSIAVRESRGEKIVKELTGKKSAVVLDPTYLISSGEWNQIMEGDNGGLKGDYILIYSLQGMKKAKKWKEIIKKVGSGVKFVTVVPFSPISGKGVVNRADAGPIEILSLFANARYIYTDTFHGMSFSIHFRKPFTVYEDTEADFRKRNILKMFSLNDRETNDINLAIEMISYPIDYRIREDVINKKISESLGYLKKALDNYSNFISENK